MHAFSVIKSARALITFTLVASSVIYFGCTAMRTTQVGLGDIGSNDTKLKTVRGASYCLPTGRVKIRVTRFGNGPQVRAIARTELSKIEQKLESVSPKVLAANIEVAKIKLDVADAEKKLAAAEKKLAAAPTDQNLAAEKVAAEKEVLKQKGILAEADVIAKALEAETKALTEALKGAKTAEVANLAHYRISHVSTEYYPDRSKQFAVRYTPNAVADDQITVEVGADSLLKSVDVKAKDMSVEISKKLIGIGKNLLEAYYRGTAALPFGDTTDKTVFEGTFDPVDPSDLAEINAALRNVEGGPYSVKVISRGSPSYKEVTSTYEYAQVQARKMPGVAYRPVLAYDIMLSGPMETQARSAAQAVHQVATVMLPNEAEILYFPLSRSAFVERSTALTFDRGMLTKVVLTKPSEINAALDIPVELTRTLAALPGQMVGASVEGLKSRTQLQEEHLKYLEKEADYQAKLKELRSKPSTDSSERLAPAVGSGSNNGIAPSQKVPTQNGGNDTSPPPKPSPSSGEGTPLFPMIPKEGEKFTGPNLNQNSNQ